MYIIYNHVISLYPRDVLCKVFDMVKGNMVQDGLI